MKFHTKIEEDGYIRVRASRFHPNHIIQTIAIFLAIDIFLLLLTEMRDLITVSSSLFGWGSFLFAFSGFFLLCVIAILYTDNVRKFLAKEINQFSYHVNKQQIKTEDCIIITADEIAEITIIEGNTGAGFSREWLVLLKLPSLNVKLMQLEGREQDQKDIDALFAGVGQEMGIDLVYKEIEHRDDKINWQGSETINRKIQERNKVEEIRKPDQSSDKYQLTRFEDRFELSYQGHHLVGSKIVFILASSWSLIITGLLFSAGTSYFLDTDVEVNQLVTVLVLQFVVSILLTALIFRIISKFSVQECRIDVYTNKVKLAWGEREAFDYYERVLGREDLDHLKIVRVAEGKFSLYHPGYGSHSFLFVHDTYPLDFIEQGLYILNNTD